jgi:hypothetical protein
MDLMDHFDWLKQSKLTRFRRLTSEAGRSTNHHRTGQREWQNLDNNKLTGIFPFPK